MNATNVLERVPIHTDAQGVVRVAGTRVTLESVVGAFESGATAEEIAQQYPTVPLVDVYSVITYYLRHKPEVDAYRAEREAVAGRVREEVERQFPRPESANACSRGDGRRPNRCSDWPRTRTSTPTSSEAFAVASLTSIWSAFRMSVCQEPTTRLFWRGPPGSRECC